MSSPLAGYPTRWILAVIDDPSEGASIDAELSATGIAAEDRVTLAGPADARKLDELGTTSGSFAGVRRIAGFLAMDQMADFRMYGVALREGRAVVGVRPRDDARIEVIELLERHGAHFINRFGSWSTEEVLPWRGEIPEVPQRIRR
jgi:hypothetical protein